MTFKRLENQRKFSDRQLCFLRKIIGPVMKNWSALIFFVKMGQIT